MSAQLLVNHCSYSTAFRTYSACWLYPLYRASKQSVHQFQLTLSSRFIQFRVWALRLLHLTTKLPCSFSSRPTLETFAAPFLVQLLFSSFLHAIRLLLLVNLWSLHPWWHSHDLTLRFASSRPQSWAKPSQSAPSLSVLRCHDSGHVPPISSWVESLPDCHPSKFHILCSIDLLHHCKSCLGMNNCSLTCVSIPLLNWCLQVWDVLHQPWGLWLHYRYFPLMVKSFSYY